MNFLWEGFGYRAERRAGDASPGMACGPGKVNRAQSAMPIFPKSYQKGNSKINFLDKRAGKRIIYNLYNLLFININDMYSAFNYSGKYSFL
jgi:hypothetical protein